MKVKNRALSRALSFLLILAMILGCTAIPGLSTGTAYAAEEETVSEDDIYNNDEDTVDPISTLVTAGMSAAAASADSPPTGDNYVTVRIEGNGIGTSSSGSSIGTVLDETVVYLSDLGPDPKAIDAVNKALTDTSLTAGEERTPGYYTTFGGVGVPADHYWRFSLNDEGSMAGLNLQAIQPKDRIVLDVTSFDSIPKYSYFKVVSCRTGTDSGYPKADVKLALYKLEYDSSWQEIPVPVTGVSITGTESWSPVTTDDVNGIAEFTLWGTTTAAETYCFNIASDGEGLSRPFCRVILTYDGIGAPDVYISQPSAADTSLKRLELSFPGTSGSVNGLNYINDAVLTVGNGMTPVSISAMEVTSGAVAAVRYKPADGSFGSEVTWSDTELGYDLAVGENVFKITVVNGSDQEIHTLTVRRSEAGSAVEAQVAGIIAGIRDVNDAHADYYYTNDWALGMAAAGLSYTNEEEEKYLANVLNLVADGSTSVSTKAKTAVALTSWNIDARQVPDKNGGPAVNLISEAAAYTGIIHPVYTAPYLLSLYDLGNYEIPDGAEATREELIGIILGAQEAGGAWDSSLGADATGMVLPALAPYYNKTAATNGISAASCAAITAAIDRALAYLSDAQEIDGGLGYNGEPNSNTMVTVITGVNALGINPHTDSRFIKSGRSMLQNLLTYQTGDNKLGYINNSTANDLACQQGLGALATYQNLSNARSSNLYYFSKEITTYTDWPDADLLTGIRVTPPSALEYSYSANETNFAVDTAGMVVTAVFNGNASNTEVVNSGYTVSTIDRSQAGTQAVTVSYQGYTAAFMVTVKNPDGTSPVQHTVSVRVKNNDGTIASNNAVVIEEGETTALDVLKEVLDAGNINYVIQNNTYVKEIDGLGEFELGENSGWMYSVNGTTPQVTAASDYVLEDGDIVLWYYSLDYTTDPSTISWRAGQLAAGADAGIATVEVTARVNAAGKATASVTDAEIAAAITSAKDSAKTAGAGTPVEVRIEVKGAGNATTVETTIPGNSVKQLKNGADKVTIDTPVAEISLDTGVIGTLAAETGKDVKITAAKRSAAELENLSEEIKKEIGDKPVFEFSITAGTKTISELGGNATIAVPYTATAEEAADGLVIYYINSSGNLEIIKDCVYDPVTKTMTFTVDHFSQYALGYKAPDFADAASHWAKDHIVFLAAREVINGMTETTFAPDSNITRAQFVRILANLAGADLNGSTDGQSNPFIDVPAAAWYAPAAAWAEEKGIVTGSADGDGNVSFHPNAAISRQDMSAMLSRFADQIGYCSLTAVKERKTFLDDAQIAGYAKEAVIRLQRAGLMDGRTPEIYDPRGSATRAESAKVISLLLRIRCE